MGTSFGLLYKYNPELSSGVQFLWQMNDSLSAQEQTELGVNVIRRYDNLTNKQVLRIGEGVSGYRGPQHILLQMINSFLAKNL